MRPGDMSPTRRREYTCCAARAVIGRACSSSTSRPVHAHSTSCGVPARSATSRTAAATRRTASSGKASASTPRRSAVVSTPRASSTKRDGTVVPPIRPSASPATASMTTCRAPVTGSTLKAAPAARGSTIRCTTTASCMSTAAAREPSAARAAYCANDACCTDRYTSRTAARRASSPSTPRRVWSCPANERSAPSSATRDDRTATRPPSRRYARTIADAQEDGRSSPPWAASRHTRVVITKPSGTSKRAARRAARLAPLPPATPRSRAARSLSQQMCFTTPAALISGASPSRTRAPGSLRRIRSTRVRSVCPARISARP